MIRQTVRKCLPAAMFASCLIATVPPPALSAADTIPSGSVFMASDYGAPPQLMFFDPVRRRIVYQLQLEAMPEERCDEPLVACAPLGVHHQVIDGDDYVDFAYLVVNERPDAPQVSYYSVVQRVRPVRPAETIWKLRTLDWSDIPEKEQYCVDDPEGQRTDPGCLLQLVHAIRIVEDLPDEHRVTLILADLDNLRVLQVTLDYNDGNTVGHVDWVLGRMNPDWPDNANVNGLDYIPDAPGGPYLLTTFYTSSSDHPASGRLTMWQWTDDDWQLAWRFPDQVNGQDGYLNTPHMGEYFQDPSTGRAWILYNHSRGDANDWGTYTDPRATFGVLIPGPTLADPPVYMMDARLYVGTSFESHFSRDTDMMPDGSLLLYDSGCENPWGFYGTSYKCPFPGRIFHVTSYLREQSLPSRPGDYTPDLSNLNLYDVPRSQTLGIYECGLSTFFEGELLTPAHLGQTLSAAVRSSRTPCPPATSMTLSPVHRPPRPTAAVQPSRGRIAR
jgi:hypothetical protein